MILKVKAEQNNHFNPKASKKTAVSPVIKTNPLDMMPILSLRDFRSASRSKGKLKLHVFNNKNHHKEINTPQKNINQLVKNYSSLSTIPHQTPKAKVFVRDYLLQKGGPLPKNIEKQKSKKEEQPLKQRKQFKLIRQIKMEKAMKAQQQAKKISKLGSQYQMEAIKGQANHEKMHAFAEEINKILQLSPFGTTQQTKIQKIEQGNKIGQVKNSNLQQYSQRNLQQSIVDVFLPEKTIAKLDQEEDVQPIVNQRAAMEKGALEDQHYKAPDLGRSFYKASRMLKQRKDSSSSIDVTLRESKVRAEISISLALQSKKGSKINLPAFYKEVQVRNQSKEKVACKDKLNAHLQILQSMSLFVYQSLKFDEIGEEWQELNFLIYKKYYIERRKVLNFLQKYPMKNPFCIYNAEISSKDLIQFMKTEEGKKNLEDLRKETNAIKEKLSGIYSKFDKGKVGEKINMYEYDNFSHWIIEQLWAELILTQHNTNHDKQIIRVRLCRILQLIFLISELSGKFQFSFEEAEVAIQEKDYESYIKEGKDIFQRYILYRSEDSESLL